MKTIKTIKKTISSLAILSAVMFLNGCTAHSNVVAVSGVHTYSHQYGVIKDARADAIIRNEIMTQNVQLQERVVLEDPSYFTNLTIDPDAFTADKFVKKPDVITYKYKFDKKFYKEAIWRKAE